jgi:2',3'-cyclic-nucleotide 2'-phosphodiesterase (5'-nucleotidase family)
MWFISAQYMIALFSILWIALHTNTLGEYGSTCIKACYCATPGLVYLNTIVSPNIIMKLPYMFAELAVIFSAANGVLVCLAQLSSKSNTIISTPVPPNTLTLIHTNDVHAHLDQFNEAGNECSTKDIEKNTCYGGAARQLTVINQLRNRNPGNTLLFDAGDQFQGTPFYSYYKGNATAEVMNDLQYDLMTIGNHEFDDGPQHLAKFLSKLNFPAVCANVDFSKEKELNAIVKPYHYFPKYDLAVIGYIAKDTSFTSAAGPNIRFYDPIPMVQKLVDEIRAKGIKRVFALSHIGYHEDLELAAKTKGLDLIIGGHSHTYLSTNPNETGSDGIYPTPVTNLEGRTTYVVQAKWRGEYLGHLDIQFDADGHIASLVGGPIHLEQAIPEEPQLKSKLIKWRSEIDTLGKKVVGEAAASFDTTACYYVECEMGNLLADALLYARRSHPQVRGVILNGGATRAGLVPGTIRMENINTIMPFSDVIVEFAYTGRQVKQFFENIFAQKNLESGNDIITIVQVSGLKVKYDPSLPAYSRVVDIQIRKAGPITLDSPSKDTFEPLNLEETYIFATNQYMIRGGDALMASTPTVLGKYAPLSEALVEYVRAASPISPKIEGRIEMVQH